MNIRVLVGASNGAEMSVELPTQFRLVDVALDAGATFKQELYTTETAYLHVIGGEIVVAGQSAKVDEVTFTEPGGSQIEATAGSNGARFVLFAGEPLRQTPVLGGPFVASDANELKYFKKAYAEGAMGELMPFPQGSLD